MMVSMVTMLANLLGNWLLIAPRCGLPGYGVVGAATALSSHEIFTRPPCR